MWLSIVRELSDYIMIYLPSWGMHQMLIGNTSAQNWRCVFVWSEYSKVLFIHISWGSNALISENPLTQAALERCSLDVPLSSLGPAVVIFHETLYTELLGEHSVQPLLGGLIRSTQERSQILEGSKQHLYYSLLSTHWILYALLYCIILCLGSDDSDDSPPQIFFTEEAEQGPTGARVGSHTQQMTAEELLRIRWTKFHTLSYLKYFFLVQWN